MSEEPPEEAALPEAEVRERIRRILVALDASPHSLAALRAAAELAARLDAEILGLYVEDINLLRLADLPLARQQSRFAQAPQPLSSDQIRQQLRSQARQAQRALERAAGQMRVRWSFRVTQGGISGEVLSAAQDSDLLVLGKVGWSRRRVLGSTARIVVAEAPGAAIVIPQGAHLGEPVGLVYDGSPVSRRALAAAGHLLLGREGFLVIILLTREPETALHWQAEARARLRELLGEVHIHFRWLAPATGERVALLAQAEGCRALVLPVGTEKVPPAELLAALERTNVPVWLVR